jgi:hypothetical protein
MEEECPKPGIVLAVNEEIASVSHCVYTPEVNVGKMTEYKS